MAAFLERPFVTVPVHIFHVLSWAHCVLTVTAPDQKSRVGNHLPVSIFDHIISYHIILLSYHNIIIILFQSNSEDHCAVDLQPPGPTCLRHIVRPIRTCLPSRELLSSRTWRLDWSMSWAMISVDFKEMDHDGPVGNQPISDHSIPLPFRCYESHAACACSWKLLADALHKGHDASRSSKEISSHSQSMSDQNMPKTTWWPGEVDTGSACAWYPELYRVNTINSAWGISLWSFAKPTLYFHDLERSYHDLASHSILLCLGF